MARLRCTLALVSLAVVATACSHGRIVLPRGPGEHFPEFRSVLAAVTGGCASLQSLTAGLTLSGRVGDQGLRGSILVGVRLPSSLRLVGVAPLGRPLFILAGRRGFADLLLQQRAQLVSRAEPGAILKELVGIRLEPHELLAILGGCLTLQAVPVTGRAYGDGWVSMDLSDAMTVYVRRDGDGDRLVAGTRGPLSVYYRDFVGQSATRIELRTADDPSVEINLRVVERTLNAPLEVEAFSFRVPDGVTPIAVEELGSIGLFR